MNWESLKVLVNTGKSGILEIYIGIEVDKVSLFLLLMLLNRGLRCEGAKDR